MKAVRLCGSLAVLGFASGVMAQPPEPKATPAVNVATFSVGQAVGETAGMASLPIRAIGSAGPLTGRITQGGTGLANRAVSLVQGGRVIVSGTTGADGSFSLQVPSTGDYVFVSGSFDAAGRRVLRVGAKDSDVQVVSIGTAAGQLVGVADQTIANPIGTVTARNERVLFTNNVFSEGGVRRFGGNEVAYLENATFKGIVTQPVALGVRRTIGGASLYLIQNGAVVARTTTNPDGSFAVPGVSPGVYSLVVLVGGSQVATVAPAAPVVDGVAFVDGATGVASPYYVGAAGGVARPMAVRFPFAAMAAQGIEIRDGAPEGTQATAAPSTAEFRVDGSTEPAINVAFTGAGASAPQGVPVVNLSPVPWGDLSPVMGAPVSDTSVGVAPIPPVEFGPGPMGFGGGGGGGFGGGGGGGGFGGAGALAGLAAAGAIAAAAAGGRGGGGNTFISPSSPLRP